MVNIVLHRAHHGKNKVKDGFEFEGDSLMVKTVSKSQGVLLRRVLHLLALFSHLRE